MANQIKTLVTGGQASAGPPLGPALGPLGVPVNQVVEKINEATKEFAGMRVPVIVTVDPKTRAFEIEVGSPPVSALIKKELNLERGSGSPTTEKVADMVIEQAIKIAMMKENSLMAGSRKAGVKTIIGTCQAMGILVQGKTAPETLKDIDAGMYDEKIESGKTELSEAELQKIEDDKIRLAEEAEKMREENEAKAKELIGALKGKPDDEVRAALKEAGIPNNLILELLPKEVEPAEGEEGAEGAKEEGAEGAKEEGAEGAKEEGGKDKKEGGKDKKERDK